MPRGAVRFTKITLGLAAQGRGTDVGMPQNVERARSLEFMPRSLRPPTAFVSTEFAFSTIFFLY
jgi:hypothetical protein